MLDSGLLQRYVSLATLVACVVAVLTFFKTHAMPWVSRLRRRHSIEQHEGAKLFSTTDIKLSMRWYVPPYAQDVDPAGEDDLRAVVSTQQELFDVLDLRLNDPGKHRYLMLLADSGMGKTVALLNYYVRHIRRFNPPFDLAVVPLGDGSADQVISAIEDKPHTSLFLDALDEDPTAIANPSDRLKDIVQRTRDFRTVLISCRTQFFLADAEMPRETGRFILGPISRGDSRKYEFYKLYLSPLTNRQVERFLSLRYPFLKRSRRLAAQTVIAQLADLSARPLVLSYVDDILVSGHQITSLGAVYDAIVEAWIRREDAFVDSTHLREFSKRLAVDLIANRTRRKEERIPQAELTKLAGEWGIPLQRWQLTGRSLLNRDSLGNYKFAHRSIMEYLFAVRVAEFDPISISVSWTDLIETFFNEFVDNYLYGKDGQSLDLTRITQRLEARQLLLRMPPGNLSDEFVNIVGNLGLKPEPSADLLHKGHQLMISGNKTATDLALLMRLLGRFSSNLFMACGGEGHPSLLDIQVQAQRFGYKVLHSSLPRSCTILVVGLKEEPERLPDVLRSLSRLFWTDDMPVCAIHWTREASD